MIFVPGKILKIDLTTKEISQASAQGYEDRFIGGRGVGAWIVFKEMDTRTQPLDPGSVIVFSTGPLTGTAFPGAGRTAIESKNVNTGGINWANMGGYFGSELKKTGWNYIAVEGKAESPVYVSIQDDTVAIRDAAHLWGADVWEAENIIRSELSDGEVQVAAIGIAGEKLVPMAIVVTNRARAAGSGGMGAIMGSKNLKAIAVKGTKEVPVADGARLETLLEKITPRLLNSPLIKAFGVVGTIGAYETHANNAGVFPYRNTQDDFYPDIDSSAIAFAHWKKTGEYQETCALCPIQCDRHILEADEGPFKGVKIQIPNSNTQYAFGCRVDMRSPSSIIKAYELISRYGLDNDQVAVGLSWAFECYEKGMLTKADTDGLDLTWGNDAAVIALIRKIATRDGFGKLLGEGSKKAAEAIGRGSEYYSINLKGQDNLDGIRACKGWSLGETVSLRGGRHLDGSPTTEFAPQVPAEVGEQLYGVPTAFQPTTYDGKGKLVSWYNRFKAAVDALGVCYFTSWWLSPEFCGPDDYAEAFSAVTGKETSGAQLMEMGRRIHNVEKAFNTLHAGFTRKDDYPPEIYMKEPIRSGPYQGERITREGQDCMLDEYYEASGWDKRTGRQLRETLESLGLPEVIEKLQETSKLP